MRRSLQCWVIVFFIGSLPFGVKASHAQGTNGTNPPNTLPTIDRADEFYRNGKFDAARPLYESAAASGSAYALLRLGNMYENAYGVPKDYGRAMQMYQKSGNLGNTDAMCYLANMYLQGIGVPADISQALVWYKKAATSENTFAMRFLGDVYSHGIAGAPTDKTAALHWYQMAAAKGDAEAKWDVMTLGRSIVDLNGIWAGFVTTPMIAEAIRIDQNGTTLHAIRLRGDLTPTGAEYFKGSWDGNKQLDIPLQGAVYSGILPQLATLASTTPIPPSSWVAITLSFDDPDHISVNHRPFFERVSYPPADDIYCKTTNAFRVKARFAFVRGEMQAREKNYDQAACWYYVALQQGHARAATSFGQLRRVGLGVKKDPEDALNCMEIGGREGDFYGAVLAAEMYEKGEGTAPDPKKALYWAAKAKELKAKEEQEELAERRQEAQHEQALHLLEGVIYVGAQVLNNELARSPQCDVYCSSQEYRTGMCQRLIEERDERLAKKEINCEVKIPDFTPLIPRD